MDNLPRQKEIHTFLYNMQPWGGLEGKSQQFFHIRILMTVQSWAKYLIFTMTIIRLSKSDRNLKCQFCGGRETGKPCHENQQQTQPKPDIKSGIQTQATAVPSCHSSQKGGEMQLSQHYPKRGDKSTKLICSTKLRNVTRKEHQLLSKRKKEGDLLLTTWNRELVFDFSSFSLLLSAKNRKMSQTSSVPSSTRKHRPVKV